MLRQSSPPLIRKNERINPPKEERRGEERDNKQSYKQFVTLIFS